MIRTHLLASLGSIALAIGLIAPNAMAQTAGMASSGSTARSGAGASRGVAVIDVTRVFTNYSRFTAAMEQFKQDMVAEDAETKRQIDAVNKLGEELQSYATGTAQYKQLEGKIVQARSDIKVRVELKRKDFGEAEAAIYFRAYQEVTLAIRHYAEFNGYSLVLRFSGEAPRQNQPTQVLQHINKSVVWVSPTNDITDGVIEYLGRINGPGSQTPPAGTSVTSRSGVPAQRR